MGLVGRSIELLRSEVSDDAAAALLENMNYKEVYPITTLHAVKETMDVNSTSLDEIINDMQEKIAYRQKIFPAKSSNNLVTYGGVEGAIGAIPMTYEIDVEPDTWSDDKIPTEKAIGNLLKQYGVFDGTISEKLLWKNIINRPTIYSTLGDDTFGLISQSGISEIINNLSDNLNNDIDNINTTLGDASQTLSDHINDSNNPHNLVPSNIGAASEEDFEAHINNFGNPHNVTKSQIGLSEVDNTSDMNKPISIATQDALDKINRILTDLGVDVENFRYVVDLQYDVLSGKLNFIFNDRSIESTIIGTGELIDEVRFDPSAHTMTFIEVSGEKINIDLSSLYVEGYTSDTVNVDIGENGEIIADVLNKSISSYHIKDKGINNQSLADDSVTERSIKNYSVTADKLAEGSVTSGKIFTESILEGHISPRAVSGSKLFSSNRDKSFLFVNNRGTDPIWSPISSDMLLDDIIETRNIIDKSVTSEKINDNINLLGIPTVNGIPIANHDYVEETINNSLLNNINLNDRSVDGRVLFSSNIKNRILGVYETNQDAKWGKVNHEMLDEKIITDENIVDKSIKEYNLADDSISARVIDNDAVISRHIRESSVSSEKIFKANERDMVLASDDTLHPVYSKVTENMLDLEAVNTQNIKNQSVTTEKLQHSDDSYSVLGTEYQNTDAKWMKIKTQMIEDSAVDRNKLFAADNDNVVLASRVKNNHPEYMKVNSDMMEDDFLQDRHIPIGSIKRYHLDPNIFELPETEIVPDNELAQIKRKWFRDGSHSVVLTINADPNATPKWSKIKSEFVEDDSIILDKLKRSEFPNRIIGVTDNNQSPKYTLLQNEMIEDGQISSSKLSADLLLQGSPHLEDHPDINSNDTTIPDTKWVNDKIKKITNIDRIYVTGERLEDHSIPLSKLEITEDKPKLLGIKNNNVEFTTLSDSDMIDDGIIESNKLQRDIKLLGSPTLDVRPSIYSSDEIGTGDEVVDSQWVNDRLKRNDAEFYEKIQDKICCLQPPNPERLDEEDYVNSSCIQCKINEYSFIITIKSNRVESLLNNEIEPREQNKIIHGDYVLSYIGNQLLDDIFNDDELVLDYSEDALINNQLIKPISEERLYDILINDVLPEYTTAADLTSYKEYEKVHEGNLLLENSVITSFLQDRAVTGRKLFTSSISNTVLAVKEANTDPIYAKVTHDMIEDWIIDNKLIKSSDNDNMILGVVNANDEPEWLKINHDMLEDICIDTNNIRDECIINDKLANFTIRENKLAREEIINEVHLYDNSITNRKIKDGSITAEKIARNQTIPVFTTVEEHIDYERRSIRNTIISAHVPEISCAGDIWFQI